MIEISKDFQINFPNSNSNRCITILAKHLRDLLAEKVSIENVLRIRTREILLRMFSEKVQELYAGIYSKELKILPTTSEN